MQKLKERNYLLDNLKVFLIFLVVFGHVIEYYIKDSKILMTTYIFIYIFHMPLFIFISVSTESMKRKAVKNLLIPYIIFNMIWYTAVYIGTKRAMFTVLYPGWTLWYLLSLFFWRIILKYVVKIKHILIISFIIGVIVGGIPLVNGYLSISRTIVFLPFFLLGYYTKEEHFEKIRNINKIYAFIGIIIFLFIAIIVVHYNLVDYKFLYNSYSFSDLDVGLFKGLLFRSILYISSIVFGACVIRLLPNVKQGYSNIGKATMNVYVFHIYLVMLVYFFIPKWNMSIIQNILILISPFLIIYILSRKRVNKVYEGIFYPVNKGIDTGKKSYKWFRKK